VPSDLALDPAPTDSGDAVGSAPKVPA
jgi:hypothetical protein